MVEKLFNSKLFEKQKLTLSIFFFTYLIFFLFPFKKEISKYTPDDLKVDINKAQKEKLILIPYIGKKTSEKIIKIRKKNGKIKIDQLKNLKNFKKFIKFIKTN